MRTELFLSNWSDVFGEVKNQDYLDYESLILSDDEFLILTSVFDAEENFDE